MLRFLVVLTCCLFALPGFADEKGHMEPYSPPSDELLKNVKEKAASHVKDARELMRDDSFQHQMQIYREARKSHRKHIEPLNYLMPDYSIEKDQQQKMLKKYLDGDTDSIAQNYISERDRPLVLVSFSLPRQELLTLLEDINKIGGQLVFRGMVDNDILKTAKLFREMFKEAGMDENLMRSITLDPTLFTRFRVDRVPTFIMPLSAIEQCMPGQCAVPDHVIATGSVSVQYFLELIQRTVDDEIKVKQAEKWLAKLEEKNVETSY